MGMRVDGSFASMPRHWVRRIITLSGVDAIARDLSALAPAQDIEDLGDGVEVPRSIYAKLLRRF